MYFLLNIKFIIKKNHFHKTNFYFNESFIDNIQKNMTIFSVYCFSEVHYYLSAYFTEFFKNCSDLQKKKS